MTADGPVALLTVPMKLSHRVRSKGELLQDFELAAEERFLDAQELLALGHGTGATYLLGYVAEMLLKNAVFRFDGAKPSDLVYPRLSPAKKWAEKSLPHINFTSFHDVLFWAHVLRKKRLDKGKPLTESVSQNLTRIAYRLSHAWAVELRYFGFEVAVDSAKRSFEDVAWLKKNHAALWRQFAMPVETRRPRRLATDQELKRRLVDEWKGVGSQDPRPRIIQEEDEQGVVVHVYVIWDDWRDMDQQARSELITEAYWELFDVKGLALTVAMGLTSEEARRMGVVTS